MSRCFANRPTNISDVSSYIRLGDYWLINT